MTEAKEKLSSDKEWVELRRRRSKLLNSRGNQVLMAFTYWQPQFDHMSDKIFELRSYTLRVSFYMQVTMVTVYIVYGSLMICLQLLV